MAYTFKFDDYGNMNEYQQSWYKIISGFHEITPWHDSNHEQKIDITAKTFNGKQTYV